MSISKILQDELNQFLSQTVGVEEHEDIELIPIGIEVLDLILGGGIGASTLTVAAGFSGAFKSTISIEVAKAFRRKYPNAPVIYIDTESSMTVARLQSIGLTGVKPLVDFTLEKVFSTIFSISQWKQEKMKTDPSIKDVPILIIWDSIANTPTEAELKEIDVNKTIGLKARILSATLPKLVREMVKSKIALYAINQYRDKVTIGMPTANELKHMQFDKTMPAGNAVKFNASQMLEFKVLEHRRSDDPNNKYGFRYAKIEIKTIKNKFFPDGYSAQLIIDVAKGVDRLFTNFELLASTKKMQVGAWNYLKSYPEKKFRTKDLREVYESDEKFRTAFDKEVKDTIEELRKKMSNYVDINLNNEDQQVMNTETNDNNNIEEIIQDNN